MNNKLGIILDPNSFQNINNVIIKAEKYNFHSAWVTELYRSSFEQLAYIASITKKIKIGSAVTLAFTRSPLSTLISALDIDELSNGRFLFGIGSGAINTNRKWHGLEDFDNPSERIKSFIKIIRKIEKSLISGEDINYRDLYNTIDLKSFRRPFKPLRQEIPIYLAGIGPKMVKTAFTEFSGYLGHVVCSLDYLKKYIQPLRINNSKSTKSIILCSINNNKAKAINDARGTIAFYATVKAYSKPFIDLGFEENINKIRNEFFNNNPRGMMDNVSDEMVTSFSIVGSQIEVLEKLEEYKKYLDLPILTAPHYYLEKEIVEEYQNNILETFKV